MLPATGTIMNLTDWIDDLRDKLRNVTYFDSAAVPNEPDGPYRARLVSERHQPEPQGIEVGERTLVQGKLLVVYITRCPCGHRWKGPTLEEVSVCPKCQRAVWVTPPDEAAA